MRRTGWLAAWALGLVLAVASVGFSRSAPDYAFALSPLETAAEVVAGGLVIASGLILARGTSARRFGVLLIVGGCGWFLLERNNPGVDSALAFTVGLVTYAAAAPFIGHGLLVYPARRLGAVESIVVVTGYVWALLLLGLVSALVYDPSERGCFQCPRNLLLIDGSSTLYSQLGRVAIYVGVAWSLLMFALLVWRLVRSTIAIRLLLGPVAVAGGAYLGLVAAELAASVSRGYLSNEPIDRRFRLAQAAAIVALAVALAWNAWRGRRTRSRLARLVVELSAAPAVGGLEQALARTLGDPGLRLAYPLADGRYVGPDGEPTAPGPASTALLRDGTEVARVTHKPGLLDHPGLRDALTATARLALEHERLRAELLAHLAELHSSRARIVATGDRERRRLERDLHDGAQQRLVALTLELGLLRARLHAQPDADRALLTRVEAADRGVRAALEQLRALATGIFPAVLADEGLVAAVEALAEDEPGKIRIDSLPERRLDPAAELAAYRIIADTVKQAVGTSVTVKVRAEDDRLVVELDSEAPPADFVDFQNLEDRVGALEGMLERERASNTHARIRAEIPCAS
jgi:signal transduction histidine kinase